jgi:zinc protease
MIQYEKGTLKNGLTIITNRDTSTSIAAVNVLYKVGSRDENPNKTGFAHLFEHLMFGGSINIPVYDEPLERAGGENNAFTNNDITNYYLTIPVQNLETAFWLESDRMLSLDFSEKALEVQKKVVVEEFRQRYLNQPYGDAWLHLRPLAYKVHPYQWPTIGKDISHIENATLDDVKSFFKKFYNPANAVLVVAGNINHNNIMKLAEKWFGDIETGNVNNFIYPEEPKQKDERQFVLKRNVPQKMIYKTWRMCSRTDKNYYASDLLSDVLSAGNSSRLYEELVKKQQIFTEINAYITGDAGEGLFVVAGRINEDIEFETAENSFMTMLKQLCDNKISERELSKVKNRAETIHSFSGISVLSKAMALAYAEFLGDISFVNKDIENYRNVNANAIKNVANAIFNKQKSCTLYYEPSKF